MMSTRTRFEEEAKGNSEMAYSFVNMQYFESSGLKTNVQYSVNQNGFLKKVK